ncbi:hypothetical protein EDB19DRAFT_105390 [Suillus lakei]|nr:hypothetical protein EDB19DRAFT_105390 [Suillus lakei]
MTVNTTGSTHLVKRVDYIMKPKARFLSLAEEIQFYILSFLPCRDILRCTSVCKALRQIYMSSSELQYIAELSGQGLLPVPNTVTDNLTPISKRLQFLRDRAHAWFKFDIHSFKTVAIPREWYLAEIFVSNGHLHFWDLEEGSAKIFPILPRPSPQTIEHEWSPGTLSSVPNSTCLKVFMDTAQNLIVVVSVVNDNTHQIINIDLGTLDGGSVHPQAAGRRLLLPEPSGYYNDYETTSIDLKGFGRHIAVLRLLVLHDNVGFKMIWELQIWDWQHSVTSNSLSIDKDPKKFGIDFCFLGNNRLLLVVNFKLKLYSIEDKSQTPQLLACFLSPLPLREIKCTLPMEDVEHCSQPQMQEVHHTMYTSDPKQRILCLASAMYTQLLIVSVRVFFDLDGTAASSPIPWERWGPANTRIFQHTCESTVQVSGNRVLRALPDVTSVGDPREYILYMMDFSSLAVTNSRGLGRVVKESSVDFPEGEYGGNLTTSLPYVEVVSDRRISIKALTDIWFDNDRIYLLNLTLGVFPASMRLEVIDV